MPNKRQKQVSGDVAIVIDYENLFYSIRSNYNTYPNLENILDVAENYGRVACSQAFADWTHFSKSLPFLFSSGVQPIFCPVSTTANNYSPTKGKSSVDSTICVQTMKIFFTNPHIDSLLLVSGDRDYIPLIIELRQMGKHVVVLGAGQSLSSDLTEVADESILYEDIDTDMGDRIGEHASNRVELSIDPYSILVEEIEAARHDGQATVLPYLKLRLRERIAGFDETKLPEDVGGPFKKFKDFILEAVDRGYVKIHTTATADEVFLPEENPEDVSHFKNIEKDVNSSDKNTPSGTYSVPPEDVTEIIADILIKRGKLPYVDIIQELEKRRDVGELFLSIDMIHHCVKSCIHYELLIGDKEGQIKWYEMSESWRNILSKLTETSAR